jgi:hypothetical protein
MAGMFTCVLAIGYGTAGQTVRFYTVQVDSRWRNLWIRSWMTQGISPHRHCLFFNLRNAARYPSASQSASFTVTVLVFLFFILQTAIGALNQATLFITPVATIVTASRDHLLFQPDWLKVI